MQALDKKARRKTVSVVGVAVGTALLTLPFAVYTTLTGPPAGWSQFTLERLLAGWSEVSSLTGADIRFITQSFIATFNLFIAGSLVWTYARLHVKLVHHFTVYYLIVSAALMMYAFLSNPIVQVTSDGGLLAGGGTYPVLPSLFVGIALVTLYVNSAQ
jgi:hypothetical protein